MNALLQQFGSPTIDYYLKVKAPAASCLAVSSLTARNSPCNTGTGPGPDDYYVSMGGTHNICNGYFYDSGGPTNDYSSNEDYTITFTASTPGSQIKIVFAWFEVNFGDLLRVYDGPTIFSPLMTNLTGFSIPNNLVSTSGSLTFRFTSASFSQESGWESQVSCITNSLAVNSSDYEICKGESIQLAATATGGNGSNYTYSWSPTATLSNSSVAQPIATPINTTNYTVTVSDGTSSVTATSSVTVHNPPSVNAGPDKFISDCAGTTNITATASGSVVYSEWDNGFTGLNNPAAHQGINTIYVEDNNGCIGSDEVTVFLVGSSQIVSFAASPTACTNSPITFTNTSAHLSGWTWRWEFGDASNATTSSAIHSYTSPGFYTVTLRGDSLTCQISFEQEVEINQCTGSLSVSVSGANQACKGGSTTLTAIVSGGSGSYNYYWTPDNFGSAFNQAYTVSPNSTTTFSVYVTDLSGNSNIASHTVTVNPSPLVDAGTDAYICPGGAAQISATTDIGTSFSWQPAIGLSCSNCANPMATPSATTTYSLTVIGQNGCSGYDDVVVYLSSSAPASVTVSSIPEEPCGGQNVQLTALLVNGGTSPAISWKRNGSVISTNSSITGQFDAGDIVTVDITSNLNCANPKDASFSINIPACVGIAETFTFGNISIYPNPNEGNFVLQIGEYPSRSNLMIELITTDGKQIYREQLQPQSNYVHNMHFEKLAAGIYLLRVSNSDGQIMKRIAVY